MVDGGLVLVVDRLQFVPAVVVDGGRVFAPAVGDVVYLLRVGVTLCSTFVDVSANSGVLVIPAVGASPIGSGLALVLPVVTRSSSVVVVLAGTTVDDVPARQHRLGTVPLTGILVGDVTFSWSGAWSTWAWRSRPAAA